MPMNQMIYELVEGQFLLIVVLKNERTGFSVLHNAVL